MRILITGSRDWQDKATVIRVLGMHRDDNNVTLVSGACPTGADKICEDVAAWVGWNIERHPADWAKYGRAAGFRRNADMVELGADVCYAFIRNGSAGATHTATAADKAGIKTIVYRDNK